MICSALPLNKKINKRVKHKNCTNQVEHKASCGMNHLCFFFRRAFKRQCTEDGTWLEGACEPVTCDPPPLIFHGSYHCTDGFRFDSVCRLNCSDSAGTPAVAATRGSALTVRLLHASCKQVCPSFPSLSILSLSVFFLASFNHSKHALWFHLVLFFLFILLQNVQNTFWITKQILYNDILEVFISNLYYCVISLHRPIGWWEWKIQSYFANILFYILLLTLPSRCLFFSLSLLALLNLMPH